MKTKISLFCSIILLLNNFYASCSFQTKIFCELNEQFNGTNLLVSPISAYQVLSLTTNGAKGKTQEEMLKVLGSETADNLNSINEKIMETFNSLQSKRESYDSNGLNETLEQAIESANVVMTKIELNQDFKDIAINKYSAFIEPLQSVEQVNNWCKEKTHGKIPKLIENLSEDIQIVLINAIYFKGLWSLPFKESATQPKPFYHPTKGKTVIDTMSQVESFLYYSTNDYQMISLPFTDDSSSAIIILPSPSIEINSFHL